METIQPFFRPEVLESRRAQWLAPIPLTMPVPYRALAIAATAIMALLVALLFVGEHTRHERVQGQLVPALGLLTINATIPGTVSHALVHENDLVGEGQPLIEISTEVDSLSIGKTRAAIGGVLSAKKASLESEIGAKKQLANRASAEFQSRISTASEQIGQIEEQLKIQTQQVETARRLLERIRPLEDQGYISGLQVQQQQASALSAESELLSMKRLKSEKQEQLTTLRGQLRDLPLTTEAEQSEMRRALEENQVALAENESQRAVVLRAPQAGMVSNLVVADGQAVGAGQRILTIVPGDSELQAHLWLPSRSAGSVKRGARVAIRYPAFPYEKYGIQYGEVGEISQSVISPAEFSALSGLRADEPQFRVVVRLDRQDIPGGGAQSLKSGMILDADILLDREPLIDWIFRPFFRKSSADAYGI